MRSSDILCKAVIINELIIRLLYATGYGRSMKPQLFSLPHPDIWSGSAESGLYTQRQCLEIRCRRSPCHPEGEVCKTPAFLPAYCLIVLWNTDRIHCSHPECRSISYSPHCGNMCSDNLREKWGLMSIRFLSIYYYLLPRHICIVA